MKNGWKYERILLSLLNIYIGLWTMFVYFHNSPMRIILLKNYNNIFISRAPVFFALVTSQSEEEVKGWTLQIRNIKPSKKNIIRFSK